MSFFSWFRRKPNRLLFRYHNGGSEVSADPLALLRRILNDPIVGDLEQAAAYIDACKEPESSEILSRLCDIFGIVRYDSKCQTGLTDIEIMAVVQAFGDYMDVVKKNTSPGPTLPPPGDLESSISLTPPAGLENPFSDLPSAPSEQNYDGATTL